MNEGHFIGSVRSPNLEIFDGEKVILRLNRGSWLQFYPRNIQRVSFLATPPSVASQRWRVI